MRELLEDLLQLASDEEEVKEPAMVPKAERVSRYHNQVKRFVYDMKITAGTVKVPVHKLIYEYYKWKGVKSAKKASSREFGRIFSLYFKPGRNGRVRYYYLNEFVPITKDALSESYFYYKKYHVKRNLFRNKNAKQKKQIQENRTLSKIESQNTI